MGGKSLLADTIIARMPEHHCYVEVFGGAGWVLFKKDRSKVEILNDLNSDLTTLYKVIKYHLNEFLRHVKNLPISREQFETFLKTDPTPLTDIQRAVRFYYLLRVGYGAKATGQIFSCGVSRPSNFNPITIKKDLCKARLRLARVTIENHPYHDLIPRVDRPDTFFYIDPPYYNCEDYYGKDLFERADFERLRDVLLSLKGKFLMSINDVPAIRELFADFKIEQVQTRYSTSSTSHMNKMGGVTELLVSNY